MSDWADVDRDNLAAGLYKVRDAARHGVAALDELRRVTDEITRRMDEEEDAD